MSVTFILLITLLIVAASLLIGLLVNRIGRGYPQIVSSAQNLQFRRAHTLMLVAAVTIWMAALGLLVTQWTFATPPADTRQTGKHLGEEVSAAPAQPAPPHPPKATPVAAVQPATEPLPEAAPPIPEPVATLEKAPAPEPPTPAPEPAQAAAAPVPKPAAPRPLIVDTGTSGLALQIRNEPDGNAIGRVNNGEFVEPLPSPVQIADGRPWIHIRTTAGLVGWVVKASVRSGSTGNSN